jgi:tRNA dimethylallyltransferase
MRQPSNTYPELLIAIFGPTAVGKTDVAVAFAQRLAEANSAAPAPLAVSLDSIAVYREIPIISGAPSSAQQAKLEHALVGIKSVTETFSAGECGVLAHQAIDEAMSTGRQVLAVGGTGLYMRAALSKLELRPPVDPSIRSRLQDELVALGPMALHLRLKELAPAAADRISPLDGRRVTRALELIASGQQPPLPSKGLWQTPPRVPTIAVGLIRSDAELKDRIRRRAVSMIEAGVGAEIRAAEEIGCSDTARAAVGWNEARDGDLDGLVTKTWQLARRQRTWFRKMDGFTAVDISGADPEEAADLVLSHLGPQATI